MDVTSGDAGGADGSAAAVGDDVGDDTGHQSNPPHGSAVDLADHHDSHDSHDSAQYGGLDNHPRLEPEVTVNAASSDVTPPSDDVSAAVDGSATGAVLDADDTTSPQGGAVEVAAAVARPTSQPFLPVNVLEAGELISGPLLLKGAGYSSSKVLFVRLEAGSLQYFADVSGRVLGEIELHGAAVEPAGDLDFVVVSAAGRRTELESDSTATRDNWLYCIRASIDALKDRPGAR